MSTLAVFLLLGGSAYAAGKINGSSLKNNSVSGKKLKAGSVSHSKLRTNAVTNSKIQASTITGSRLAPNTLTDREINMAKLGKISKAATADNAGKVDNKDASQLTDRCASGTADLGSACAETGTRASALGYDAAKNCTAAGGYLPSAAELIGAAKASKISISGTEWSSDWSYDTGAKATTVTAAGVAGAENPGTASQFYRCFFTLRER
jgi:hypothetical protein